MTTHYVRTPTSHRTPTTLDLVDRLIVFEGSTNEFLSNLLAVQCHITGAGGGAILRAGQKTEIVSVFPHLESQATAPIWLAQAAEAAPNALATGHTVVKVLAGCENLYEQFPPRHLVMLPIRSGRHVRGLAAFVLDTPSPQALSQGIERLELSSSLLSLYEMRLTLQQRQDELRRLRTAMETLAAMGVAKELKAASMAICNELSASWNCQRASIGFLKGRRIRLAAMSHVEQFSRKADLVQAVECAMEECVDQDAEVLHPTAEPVDYVARSAGELSCRYGPCCVLTLPLRCNERVVGAITLERSLESSFSSDEVESLRLMCELCTGPLLGLLETDRWIGGRAARAVSTVAARLVGPRHADIKLLAAIISGLVLFAMLGRGQYQAEAPFVFQAVQRQLITAPMALQLKEVHVVPGQQVRAGQTLATLDAVDLRWQREQSAAEGQAYFKQRDAAMSEGKTADAQIAQAQADKSDSRTRLLDEQIRRAVITAPMDGVVLKGDWQRKLGSPLESGQVLFELAPLQSLRAELAVPEEYIPDVQTGQQGRLATVAFPSRHIDLTVERIDPVAEVVDQKNVFKVRATLPGDFMQACPWARPGMEGLAKIDLGSRRYAWIWTRKAVNFARMKLWI